MKCLHHPNYLPGSGCPPGTERCDDCWKIFVKYRQGNEMHQPMIVQPEPKDSKVKGDTKA